MKSYLNAVGCRVLVAILAATAPWLTTLADDFTAVDAQGVVYDKIEGTNNVIISRDNSNKFRNKAAELVIPAVITDVSTSTSGSNPTYNVVGIRPRAFQYSQIKSIDIQAPIPELADSAFYSCSNLQSVSLPKEVTRIGKYSFYYDSSIRTFSIAENSVLEEIGTYAFYECYNITGFNSPTVKRIDNYAFYDCSGLQTVSIPNIETMGSSAFSSCSYMTTIDMGNKLTEIPNSCFSYCYRLTNVTVPETVEIIQGSAFNRCYALTITNQWPATLKEIEGSAFQNCTSLGKLKVQKGIKYDNYAFSGAGFSELEWPDEYVELGEYCFSNIQGLETLTLPSWMKETAKGLFSGSEIVNLILGDNLDTVGYLSFQYCHELKNINFGKVRYISQEAFDYCSGMEELTIPAGIYLGYKAFARNNLTTLNLPEEPFFFEPDGSLTNPFSGSYKLTTFVLPSYLTRLAGSFFEYWYELVDADLTPLTEELPYRAFYGSSKLQTVKLSDNIKTIRTDAFYGCSMLENVTLGEGLETVEGRAFYNCKALKKLRCSATNSIDKTAFSGCTALSELELSSAYIPQGCLPNSLTSLKFFGEKVRMEPALKDNTSFKPALEFLPGVKEIADSCFQYYININQITFADGVEKIGDYAFFKCQNLQLSEKLPTSIKEIGKSAFANVNASKVQSGVWYPNYPNQKIDLPNIEKIGDRAFYNSFAISEINLPQDKPYEIGEYAMAKTSVSSFTVPSWMTKVPKGLLAETQSTEEGTLILHDGIKEVGDSAFYGLHYTALTFPKNEFKIGDFAFAANRVQSLTLPSYITELPKGFMADCSSLTEITNLQQVTGFGERSMQNIALEHPLEYVDNVEYIGPYAFYNSQAYPYYHSLHGIWTWNKKDGIEIPEQVELDHHALAGAPFRSIKFTGCRSTLPKGCFEETYIEDGITFSDCLTEIPDSAFFHKMFHNDKAFPDFSKIKRIGKYAFANTQIRMEFTINLNLDFDVLEEIGDYAFYNAGTTTQVSHQGDFNLNITWPDHPVKLGKYAFAQARWVQNLEIPKWMTEVPEGCFIGRGSFFNNYGTYNLTVADRTGTDFPKKIHIGKNAFQLAKAEELDLSDWDEVTLDNAAFCGTFIDEIKLPGSCTEIPDSCFYYSHIKRHNFREGLKEIGSMAFYSATLSEVTLPMSLEKLHENAFACCKMTDLTIKSLPDTIPASAFGGCNQLVTASLAENIRYLAPLAFQNSSKLASIKIPNATLNIEADVFKGCTGLRKLDLGIGLKRINYEAFKGLPIEELVWSPELDLEYIGSYAFSATNIKELQIPDGWQPCKLYYDKEVYDQTRKYVYYGVSSNIFSECKNLKKVTFSNNGDYALTNGMFENCTNLESVNVGNATFIPNYTFRYCSSLSDINLDGIQYIELHAFNGCSSLPETFTLPASVTKVSDNAFQGCTGIKHLKVMAPHIQAGSYSFGATNILTAEFAGSATLKGGTFRANRYLETFKANGDVSIGSYTFYECPNLKEVIIQEPYHISELCRYSFYGCKALETFPTLRFTKLDSGNPGDHAQYTFQYCTSLRQVEMPEDGDYVPTGGGYYNSEPMASMFNGCTSLQSLIFPHTDPKFRLEYYDISDAPLQGVSYSYATDIPVYPESKVVKYDENGWNWESEAEKKGILYVKRGQQWKYEDAGYGYRFNIMEMKEPQVNIEGNIFSDYDKVDNVNHYTGYLRWQMCLSDLDDKKPTVAHIYRKPIYPDNATANNAPRRAEGDDSADDSDSSETSDASEDRGEEIAVVSFSVPSAPMKIDNYDQEVIEVEVSVSAPEGSALQSIFDADFQGGFELPILDANGNTQYIWVQAEQGNKFYFDAKSTKRLDSFDNWNNTSWIILCDHFDSPELTRTDVPMAYVYSAEVEPYDYTKYVNTDNFEEVDGVRYKEVTDNTAQFKSTANTFNAAVILPTIDFEGCHSWDAVSKDQNHGLEASKGHSPEKEYRLGWRIIGDDLDAPVYVGGEENQVFDKISIVEIDQANHNPYILENHPISTDATGNVEIQNLSTVKAGKKYQIVVHSPSRGWISSRALTIPDRPDLKFESFGWGYAPHFQESPDTHTNLNVLANMTLKADAFNTGYPHGLPKNNFHFGAWRTVAPYAPTSFRAEAEDEEDASETNTTVLLHHIGGVQHTDEAPNCGTCAQETAVNTNADGTITISDYFHHERGVNNTYSYDTRLYVKVPDSMIPGDERWMAVDANNAVTNIVSGIDEVVVDQILGEMQTADEDIRWYDLQGRPVATPLSGQPYIRATRTSATVVVAP